MRMKRWLTTVGMVGLILLALAAPGVQAASKTLYVGTCKGPSSYTTIQSAVDAVNDDGFTIYVCPGTYNESVSVQNKEKLTIRNYVIKNQPAPLMSGGIDVRDSEKVEIRGLRITNTNIAIIASNSPETKVHNTIITNASQFGIAFLDNSDKSEAQDNTITGTRDSLYGIEVGRTNNVTIKQNTITSFPYGVYVFGADKSKIESNSVTNVGQTGILLAGVTRATVKKNTTSFAGYGITLSGSTTSTISENTAQNNSTAGLYVENDSTNNTFKKNLLQGNGTDAVDNSTGSKTAGTANTWTGNTCDTSTPGNLCGSPATTRRVSQTP